MIIILQWLVSSKHAGLGCLECLGLLLALEVAPPDVFLVDGPSVEHAGHALLPPVLGCHAEVGTSCPVSTTQ